MISRTSSSNPKVKQIRALRQPKERKATGLFVVEGIRHVGEAVEAGAEVVYGCYCPEMLKSEYGREVIRILDGRGVPVVAVSPEVFTNLAEKENPQGLLGVVRKPQWQLASLGPKNFKWGVALVAPQDPGNIGTILRTVDAVGASGLLLLDRSADLYQFAGVRASMGTLFWLPVVQASFQEFKTWADANQYTLYGTSAHGQQLYEQMHYTQPMILVLGSEREGLTPAQSAACHHSIRLPMRGRATSLNLSVAAGVMLYDMLHKTTPSDSA